MSAPSIHTIRIIQPAGLGIATVRVSPPRGEPGPPGADGADGETRTWEDLEGKPATFPPASHTHAAEEITGLTESMASKADLVGGVIPTAQIPAIAITSYLGSVASQAAMLGLSGQTGDWCNRSDTSTAWVITGGTPNQLSSWSQISYPASPVTSVNGQSGVITLGYADVGAVPATRQITTTGLATGGGSLSANCTISVPAATSEDVLSGSSTTSAVTPQAARRAVATLCSRIVGLTGSVNGYTDLGAPGDPGEPPADLVLALDVMDFSINGMTSLNGTFIIFTRESMHRRYYFATELDMENPGDVWIDTTSLISMWDCFNALKNAMQADFPDLTFDHSPDDQLRISGFSPGASSTWTISISRTIIIPSATSAQGEDGAEEIPPSGEQEIASLHFVAGSSSTRLLRAWVTGTFVGAQARFALHDGVEPAPLGDWFSAPGELQLMSAPDAFFDLPTGQHLVLQLSSPVPGASIQGRVLLSMNS